jgi:CRISPR system Cascade subunit CasD
MTVLLLRLAGPMQSWGTQSRFTQRDTGLEPSRSGVIGLLCAGLGRPRNEPLDDFRPLRMGVRVDREGRLMRDYQTAGGEHSLGSMLGVYTQGRNRGLPRPYGVVKADGSGVGTVVSERFYLADADFLVGLEGERPFLERLYAALQLPVWPLYLGRKAFVPAQPVAVGVGGGELAGVLKSRPWRKRRPSEKAPTQPLRYVLDEHYGAGEPRNDVPLSFLSRDRRFGVRHVKIAYHELQPDQILEPDEEEPPCF